MKRGLNESLNEQVSRKPQFGDVYIDDEGTTWQVEKIGPSIRLKAIKGKKAQTTIEFPSQIWSQYMHSFKAVPRKNPVGRQDLGMRAWSN